MELSTNMDVLADTADKQKQMAEGRQPAEQGTTTVQLACTPDLMRTRPTNSHDTRKSTHCISSHTINNIIHSKLLLTD